MPSDAHAMNGVIYYSPNDLPFVTSMTLAFGFCCCVVWMVYLVFLATFIFGVICMFRLAIGHWRSGEHDCLDIGFTFLEVM